MGILLSAMAGAGDSAADSIEKRLQQQRQMDIDANRSELEKQKQLAILQATKQAQIDTANQLREAQAARLGSAKDAVVAQQMGQKYAQSDDAVAAADAGQTAAPLTSAQKDAIEQSKALDLKALADDPHTYIAAAMKTGDIDPKTVAELAQRADELRRAEVSQQAGFAHTEKMEAQREAHAEKLAHQSQAFQSSQEDKRLKAMYGDPSMISDAEKKNWVQTYIDNGGTTRSLPASIQRQVGTWAAQMGITADDIHAGKAKAKFDQSAATTAGNRAGAMANVKAAIPAIADNALELASKLKNGKFVPLNKLMMMADDSISDPDLAAFKVAHMALVSEYQQVIARGGTNVTALKEAMHVLESASNYEAYAAKVNQVKREVDINLNAANKVRNEIGGNHHPQTVDNPVAAPGKVLTYDPSTGTFH